MKKLNKTVFMIPVITALPIIAAVSCSSGEATTKFKVETPAVISKTPQSTILKVKITDKPEGAKVSEFSLTIQEKGKTTEATKKTFKGSKPLEGQFISFDFGILTDGTEYELVEVMYKKDKTEIKVPTPKFEFKVETAPQPDVKPAEENKDASASDSSGTSSAAASTSTPSS